MPEILTSTTYILFVRLAFEFPVWVPKIFISRFFFSFDFLYWSYSLFQVLDCFIESFPQFVFSYFFKGFINFLFKYLYHTHEDLCKFLHSTMFQFLGARCWDLTETHSPGGFYCVFMMASRHLGLGMCVILGVDIWSCLCWVGGLFLGVCCFLWFLGVCGGCVLPGRNASEIQPVVATGGSRYNVFLGAESWHLGMKMVWRSGEEGL